MKSAVPDSDQTLLGYHSQGKSSSARSYGRDALAGPLRALEQVLTDIRDGKSKPDQTRQGQVAGAAQPWQLPSSQPPPALIDQQEPQPLSDSVSTAEEPQSEGSSGDDVQLLQRVSHSLALAAGNKDFQFLSHVKSGIVHISRKEADRLLCGRTVDFSRAQACLTCQSVADGLCAS
ncbi:unnamed protein product [Symbiodinium sp. CCMP2592]|nr:unnamed protein product [Symbiodinium sp. CCMP2592]